MHNIIQVNIILAETQSSEKGLDLCKWTETWASLEHKSWKNAAVADEISCFQTSFMGQSWPKWQLHMQQLVIQHMSALNKIAFCRWLLVCVYFWNGHLSTVQRKKQLNTRAHWEPFRSVASNSLFMSLSSTCLHIFCRGGGGGGGSCFLLKIFSQFVFTAVIFNCTYMDENWFSIIPYCSFHQSHWLWSTKWIHLRVEWGWWGLGDGAPQLSG